MFQQPYLEGFWGMSLLSHSFCFPRSSLYRSLKSFKCSGKRWCILFLWTLSSEEEKIKDGEQKVSTAGVRSMTLQQLVILDVLFHRMWPNNIVLSRSLLLSLLCFVAYGQQPFESSHRVISAVASPVHLFAQRRRATRLCVAVLNGSIW